MVYAYVSSLEITTWKLMIPPKESVHPTKPVHVEVSCFFVSTDACDFQGYPWMKSMFLDKNHLMKPWRLSDISLVGNWKPREVLMTLDLGPKAISKTWYVTLWYN